MNVTRTTRASFAVLAGLTALLVTVVPGPEQAAEATPTVDAPEGFSAEVLAGHATFPDDVTAKFKVLYEQGGAVVSNLQDDASAVVVARVTWQPGGTSGWHTHPGPAIVSIVDGTVEVTNADGCAVRTYTAGEAFLDPGQGNVHIAANASDGSPAVAYATFLGVPPGQPATIWAPEVTC